MSGNVHPWLTFLAAGAMATASCSREQIDDPAPPPPGMSPGVAAKPPSRTLDPRPTAPSTIARITESPLYGRDEIVGVLHVTAPAAYYEAGDERIILVQAPPVTAMGASELMADAARALRRFAGKQVSARGDLQGNILWEAQVTSSD